MGLGRTAKVLLLLFYTWAGRLALAGHQLPWPQGCKFCKSTPPRGIPWTRNTLDSDGKPWTGVAGICIKVVQGIPRGGVKKQNSEESKNVTE